MILISGERWVPGPATGHNVAMSNFRIESHLLISDDFDLVGISFLLKPHLDLRVGYAHDHIVRHHY